MILNPGSTHTFLDYADYPTGATTVASLDNDVPVLS